MVVCFIARFVVLKGYKFGIKSHNETLQAIEETDGIDNPTLDEIYQSKTSHLTPTQSQFFAKWERLISLEERDMDRFKREIWTMTASQRQAIGRCFANMVIDRKYFPSGDVVNSKIHRFTYRLTRPPDSQESLLGGHIAVGDPILVSQEPHVLALARGFVLDINAREIILGLGHTLDSPKLPTGASCFRVDRDELTAGMGRLRDNLAKLFYLGGDEKRRRLLVDLEPPKFSDQGECISEAKVEELGLNEDQVKAINKVQSAEDYALILGMPGTGKTTTIAHLISALVSQGKTILLTSYTHSAVDNILVKILANRTSQPSILRLGNADKVRFQTIGTVYTF